MDQHPIPQDVTGFQFKLIGSMTVKQFAYVAAGVITAVILYYLPLKMSFAFLLKTLLIPLFGISGFVIAFVPIDGRPIDVMTGNFMKALFSPNQYIYRKSTRRFSFSAVTAASLQQTPQKDRHATTPIRQKAATKRELQLQAILHSSEGRIKNKLDEKEMAFLHTISTTTPVTMPQAVPHFAAPLAQPKPLVQPSSQHPMVVPMAPHPVQQMTQQAMVPPAHLPVPLPQLQTQPAAPKPVLLQTGTAAPRQAKPPPPPQIPLEHAKTISLPHTADVPNVVTGIVKDPRGNVLPNILVEVKDKEGNPIRAFKTNGLGHFASATPLPYGMYTIELEDPKKQHSFGVIQLNASNHIMQPIEIVSHDAREQLRQELFN